MVRMILSGCSGRMGKVITELVGQEKNICIAAGIDVAADPAAPYPVYASFGQCKEEADVVVDFSSPKVFDAMMDYCVGKSIPAVICTTGLSEEQLSRLQTVSGQVALLRSANMSIGVNTLMDVLSRVAPMLSEAGFDIEIVEKHHNRKKDAPSGTAIALADSINSAVSEPFTYVYDRSSRYEQRSPREIGISAVRGGTIVGEHDVIFAGTDEVLTFSHMALSRAIFAKGAIAAAKFLAGKKPGYYTMADVIKGDQS